MTSSPDVSVIMSVYNVNDNYLKKSIESILNQTYENFEFIIIDDCTNQDNINTINSYKDNRIVLIRNQVNLGLTKSLNKAILVSKGKYIARMDADDISILNRFEKQVNYLEKNQDTIVVGGLAKVIGRNSIPMSRIENQEVMRMRSIFSNCIMVHPTAMINHELLNKYKISYDESVRKAQDYMFWADCLLNKAKICVLDEVVLEYRIHEEQDTNKCSNEQIKCAQKVQRKLLSLLIDNELNEEIMSLHHSIVQGKINTNIEDYTNHFINLLESNEIKQVFDVEMFKKECYYMFLMMTVKGIVHYRDFKGLKSPIFWNAIFKIQYWKYYFDYIVIPIKDEKKVLAKLEDKSN